MLKFITNIQISRRLLFAFLFAAVVPGIIISILGFAFIHEQQSRSQAVETSINIFKTATTTQTTIPTLLNQLKEVYQSQYTAKPAEPLSAPLNRLNATTQRVDQALHQYQQNDQVTTAPQVSSVRSILLNDDPQSPFPAQQQAALRQVMNSAWPAYQQAQQQVLAAINSKAPITEVDPLLQNATAKHQALATAWQQVIDSAEHIAQKVAQVGPTQTNTMLLAIAIAFLTSIIIVTGIGSIIYLTITRPLHQLASLTRRIARGDTQARASIRGNDEISLVANSMNTMLDHIVHLFQETEAQRDRLQAQVEKLVGEVSGIGEGDLRIKAEVSADALGVLADSFNYMIEELGSLVVRVKLVSGEVEHSTATILKRMTQLVETGTAQLNSIAQVSTEVERMTNSSRQVAERSQVLYEVARVARQDAQVGRESLQQAVENMGRINANVQATANKVQTLGERSREINDIVEAISSIAHQTNRLALDAAIQAAMAGENGKGFGAVAADIRRLAERSKDQANMITRIVRNIAEVINAVGISMQDTERETAAGSLQTQEAGTALESIFAAVEHQAHEIEHIKQMAEQQLQSASAVAHIMRDVSESTRQGSINTRDASESVERLARLVEQLRTSVEAFKLRENRSYHVPTTSISLDNEQDTPLTVSGVFRRISAPLPPMQINEIVSQATGENTPLPTFSLAAPPPSSQSLPVPAHDWNAQDAATDHR